jgi:hypothetical protein
MPITEYSYGVAANFPNGLYENNFSLDIQSSSIVTALVSMSRAGGVLTISFADALSAGEKTTLDNDQIDPAGGLIAAHNPTPPQETVPTAQIISATVNNDKDNYGGPSTVSAFMVRLNPTTNVNITGFENGAVGRIFYIHNVGAFNITLKDESASSLAANRLALSMDLVLAPDECVALQYDSTSLRWRDLQVFPVLVGDSGAGGRKGMAPAPASGDAAANKFLKANGTWSITPNTPPTGPAGGDLGGNFPNPTTLKASEAFAWTGDISPSNLSSDQIDYSPTGLSTAAVIRLTATTAVNITGLSGGSEGRFILVHNVGSNAITLKDEDVTSAAANRFALTGDAVLITDKGCLLRYDDVSQRWRIVARQSDPYGSTTNTICQGNDSRLSDARTPISHASSHQPGGGDAMSVDSAVGTGSLRTIGTGPLQACAGNDSRLTDDRTAAGLRSATTVVAVSGAAAPTTGQVLTATGGSGASWQTPSGGAASDLATTGASVNVSGAAPPSTGQVLIATSATTATWQPVTASPAGSTTQVQYNNAGAFAGTAGLVIDAGGLPTVGELTTPNPAAPTAGSTLFSRFRAGRRMPGARNPNGDAFEIQPGLMSRKVAHFVPRGNSTTADNWGFGVTVTGTATSRSVATTNLSTSLRRIGYVSSATAGNSAGVRGNAAQFWQGNGAGLGGFYYQCQFIVSQTNADVRWFVGLSATTGALANANPTTLLNLVGFSIDSTQTTIRFINNDGSGTATSADQGANFPATTTTAVYEIRLFCAPNTTEIFWSIERFDSAFFATGSVTTDIPTNTTLLSPQVWINNGATASAVAIDVIHQYMETDH